MSGGSVGKSAMLPDAVHIEQIRAALWKGREFGRAAVFIGAGFSRNAKAAGAAPRPLPLWSDLARRLIDELYPATSSPDWERRAADRQAQSVSGALRLAQEFEAAHGRHRLNQLVRESVADLDWEPGTVHRLMMELPWSDVFTTNYDTLLERAAALVVDRKYDVVQGMSEIAAATRPRIVKLHGSYPATYPFILTEEDFRTYPRRFAPFVNLVQQSMMENVVCLVGFSGDDPNFLYWTGWVRDQLGETAPKIYLCGVLSLNAPRRRLLEDRNVAPIDLAPLFPRERYTDSQERHYRAMEWLLRTLAVGRPPDPLLWPRGIRSPRTSPLDPPLIPPTLPEPCEEPYAPFGELDDDRLLAVVNLWATNRRLYPGWLIAPHDSRESLLRHSTLWIERIIAASSTVGSQHRLRLLDELNWRLETALTPLPTSLADAIRACLETIHPFAERLDLPEPVLRLTSETLDQLPWAELRTQWIALAFALLRYSREERQHEAFSLWATRLETLIAKSPESQARLCYERCLHAFGKMDEGAARAVLAQWPSEEHDPIWSIRKAAVFVELGELREARGIANAALERIRTQAKGPDDIPSLSREGWAMLLVRGLELERRIREGVQLDYGGRWEHLARFHCDPWDVKGRLQASLNRELPRQEPPVARRPGFLPGTTTQMFQGPIAPGAELLPSYQFMRLTEEAAYPPSCGNVRLSAETLETAARWCAELDPVRTLTLLCRLRSRQLIEHFLTRERVAALPMDAVNELLGICRTVIDHAESRAMTPEDSPENRDIVKLARQRLEAGIELLARMAIRLPSADASQLLTRALRLYHSPVIRASISLPEVMVQLFASLLGSMSVEDIGSRVGELMALSIPGPDFSVRFPQFWLDVMLLLPERVLGELRGRAPAGWNRQIQSLLDALNHAGPDTRGPLVHRLQLLRSAGYLGKTDTRTFARRLWKNTDPQTQLPEVHPLPRWFLLRLPEPQDGIAVQRMRAYLLGGDICRFRTRHVQPDGRETSGYATQVDDAFLIDWHNATAKTRAQRAQIDRRYLDWSLTEVSTLFEKLRVWWEDEGRAVAAASRAASPFVVPMLSDSLRERVERVLTVLRDVVMPRVTQRNRLANQIVAFVEELEKAGFLTQAILPALLKYRPGAESVATLLHTALTSMDESTYMQGVRGLLFWVQTQGDPATRPLRYALPPPPQALFDQLVANLAGRRQPGLRHTIDAVSALLSLSPQAADPAFLSLIEIGMNHLLTEAAYRTKESIPTPIPDGEVPAYRVSIARLARRLSDIPGGNLPTVQQWIEGASADTLPEVRQAVTPGTGNEAESAD